MAAVFSSIYCAYALIVVSMYLVGYTHLIDKQYQAEPTGTGQPATSPESKSDSRNKPDKEGRSR